MDEEDIKCSEERGQETKDGGIRPEGHGHEGKGQRQRKRETATLLRLEQQQWGLCWTPTRLRLQRKRSKRAKLWKSRTPIASMLQESRLITWLRKDWERAQKVKDTENSTKAIAVPVLVMAGSGGTDRQNVPTEDRSRSSRRSRRARKRDSRNRKDGGERDEPKATIDGRRLTIFVSKAVLFSPSLFRQRRPVGKIHLEAWEGQRHEGLSSRM